MNDTVIELVGVKKTFQKPALRDVTFAVRRGEILGFLGPNGSGKTTTVRLMAGVLTPDAGRITVGGYDPEHDGDTIRRVTGIMTETAGLYGSMTGRDNLRFFAELYGVDDRRRPDELLEIFGLSADGDRKVGVYSTGMRKRLGLAKALLHQPEILILDEPTSGLDPEGIRLVLEYIAELNRRQGTTVILCSHVLQQLETLCHRYVFLSGGRTIEQGTLAELEAKYRRETVVTVETDLVTDGPAYHGIPVRRLAKGRLEFRVGGTDRVPDLLRRVLQEAAVYGASIAERDLQSIYFKIEEATRNAV